MLDGVMGPVWTEVLSRCDVDPNHGHDVERGDGMLWTQSWADAPSMRTELQHVQACTETRRDVGSES